MQIEIFMEELVDETSSSTAAKYGEVLYYLEEWLAENDLELEQMGSPEYKQFRVAKGWGNAYERLCLIALKRYLRWAGLTSHTLLDYKIKAKNGKAPRAYHPDEMESIIASVDRRSRTGKRGYPMLLLQWDTGIRSGEICGLELADVDIERKRFEVLTKGDEWETKIFSERTADALKQWLRDREDFVTNGTTWLFVSVGGTMPGQELTVNGLRAIYRKMGKQAGLKLSPHDVRRSFAIAAVINGSPIPILMKQGGWRNLKVFMDYLRRLMPGDFEPYLPTNGGIHSG